jgi:hypothetical protein
VGGELAVGSTGSKQATPTTSKIYLNGKDVQFTAYNIGGNNYFKLRDLGESFNFGIDWDGTKNTIIIDTSKGYTPESNTNTGSSAKYTYLKNFPTIPDLKPLFTANFGIDSNRITIAEDNEEIFVYIIDRRNNKDDDPFLYDNYFSDLLSKLGFDNIEYYSTQKDSWDKYIVPGDDWNSYSGVYEKNNIRAIYIVNGNGSKDVDVFVAVKIK